MTGKADFTEDEWEALQKGVTGAGMLVSVADRDFTDSFGEASALAKQLATHRENESQLVRDLSGTHGTGFGMTASPEEILEGTINALATAVETLGEKAPSELEVERAGPVLRPVETPEGERVAIDALVRARRVAGSF